MRCIGAYDGTHGGGRGVREGGEFFRLVLRYTVAGHAESLTREVYRRV